MKGKNFTAAKVWAWRAMLLAAFFSFGAAHASEIGALEKWRNAVVAARTQAENDIPSAYREVQRLQQTMPGEASAADKVRIVNLLARVELYLGLTGKSAQHGAEAKEIAKRNKDRDGQVEADLVIALTAINQGRLEDMVEATRDGMDLLAGLDREDLRAEEMFQAAMMYVRFKHFDEAITIAMQSLDIARSSGDPWVLAHAEQGMAVAYMQSGLTDKALDHYQRMLEAARRVPSALLEGNALLGLSDVAGKKGDHAGQERQCKNAVALYRRAGGPVFLAHALYQLAEQYILQGQPEKALPLLDENVAIYEQRDNPIGLWWTLNERSTALQKLGRLDDARRDAERADGLAKRIGFTVYLSGSARRLSAVAEAQGDYQRAYRLSEQALALSAKAERENSSKRILELAEHFQQESKQRKIDELTRQNKLQEAQQRWLWSSLIAGLLVLAVALMFLLHLRRSREQIREMNEGLEQRVQERTAELREKKQSLMEAQRIAHLGSWENDLVGNVLTWSDEIYRIFEIDPDQFGASYEAFMAAVHPDDRQLVDRTYKEALEKRLPFEIEHRLLLPDGRIKYVHERCETVYADDGKPLRSIGTVQDITERKEMENALSESRQLMAEAQRIALVGSWEYDIASDIHTWSDELFRIYEIDPAEGASYEGCMNATHPDDREAVANAYLRSVEAGRPYESEHRLLMKDGRVKYVHERGETVCGPDGRLLRAVGMMQDITERVLAERKLKEALEFTEGVINAIPDVLFEVNGEGRYLNVWTHTPELLAAQKDYLIGNLVGDVLAPEAAATVMMALREAEEKGVSLGKAIRIALPQGIGWFELSVSRMPGGSGAEARFLVLSRDVTARVRMETELRDSRNFLDRVIDSVPDPVFVKDRQHRWILLNEAFCRFTGLPRAALIGKSDYEVFPKGEADVFWEKDELVFGSGEVNLNEESFTPVGGEAHFIQTKKTPFTSTDGSQMLVGVIRDISQRRQLESAREAALEEATRLAKLRRDFLAHVSHELRTPLNGILGYTQVLLRDKATSERHADALSVIRQSGEHLLSLIEDILDLTRIEAGRFQLDIGDITLAPFLRVICDIIGIKAREKGVAFSCEAGPDLSLCIRGDERRLRQVLLNLLSNAVKFTGHGQVVLRVRKAGPERIAFAIEDTGSGIEADKLETIFQPFEQAGDARQRQGGSGLGLSISRQLVRLMGGDIAVESRMGEGSIFCFELELPEAGFDAENKRPDAETADLPRANVALPEPLFAPPREEMEALHRLALLGNMRDIVQFSAHLDALDSRYRPFAARLRKLAEGYQSKAVLALVESYLNESLT